LYCSILPRFCVREREKETVSEGGSKIKSAHVFLVLTPWNTDEKEEDDERESVKTMTNSVEKNERPCSLSGIGCT
jgi:hypothetical protein